MARCTVIICGIFLLTTVLMGCGGDAPEEKHVKIETALRALSSRVGRDAEEKGELHEAEKNYKMAIQYAKEEGYVSESLYEDLHRVQKKLKAKYE